MEWANLIFSTIPQFGFAAFLFWMCNKNADKQRDAYQQQLGQLYALIEKALESANELIEAVKRP